MEVIEAFGFGRSGIRRDDFLQVEHVVQLGWAPNRIDILTGISGVAFDEAWKSREQGNISGVAVFVMGVFRRPVSRVMQISSVLPDQPRTPGVEAKIRADRPTSCN